MKRKFTWWQILSLIFNLVSAVFLVLCIATDMNDEVFLPVALSCVLVGNCLQLVCNYVHNKKINK